MRKVPDERGVVIWTKSDIACGTVTASRCCIKRNILICSNALNMWRCFFVPFFSTHNCFKWYFFGSNNYFYACTCDTDAIYQDWFRIFTISHLCSCLWPFSGQHSGSSVRYFRLYTFYTRTLFSWIYY